MNIVEKQTYMKKSKLLQALAQLGDRSYLEMYKTCAAAMNGKMAT